MIDELLKALAAMSQSFGRRFTSLETAIREIPDKIAAKQGDNSRLIAEAINGLKAAVSNPTVNANVELDTSVFTAELSKIAALTANNKPDKVDLSDMAAGIKILASKLDDNNKQFATIFSGLSDINTSVKGIKPPPSTFKLDDMQLRALATSASGGTNGGNLAARNAKTTNLSLAASNTQYSHTFAANTVAFTIKLRAQGVLGYYSWVTGTMPSGGDASNYMTIPQNFLRSKDGVDYSGKTIYLGAASNSQIAEIEEFML